MPPPAAPTSTKEQVGAALQTAGQYAGGSTVWTPENAEELGLDPERGYIAKGTPTDQPQPTLEQLRQELQQSGALPKPITPTTHPGLHGFTNGEQAAPSQQSQQNGALPKDFIPDEKKEGKAAPLPKDFIPDEQKEQEKPLPKDFVPEEEGQKEAAAPSIPQKPGETAPDTTAPQPPQPQQPATPMPSGTGAGASQGAPLVPGRDAHINALIASGKTPGEAQAIADGQEPKTVTGQKPQPKPKQPPDIGTLAGEQAYVTGAPVSGIEQQPAEVTKPTTPQQAQGDRVDWGKLGYKSFEQYQKFVTGLPAGLTVTKGPGTTATVSEGAQTEPSTTEAPSTTTTEEPPKVVEGNKIQGTSTVFGLNYDGSVDPDDNGRGFFGGVNTRNPNLKAVAVPVDVLEKVFGHFAQLNAQGTYDMVDTPEARAIVKQIQSAHVEAIGADGKIHKFPIVDIQGSLKGHPGKVLDLTYGAAKDMGFADNHKISYQIIAGDGKPYPIPDNIEFAGDGSKGPATGPGGPAGPWISVGGAPSGGGAAPAQFRGPPEGGGGGAQPDYSPSESRAEPISLAGLGGLLAGGAVAGGLFRGGGGQPPVQRPAEEEPQPPAGGIKPANVLGVRTISAGPPPPAPSSLQAQLLPPPAAPTQPSTGPQPALPPPSAPSKGPDPAVVKALMKRGFTRAQAEAFAAKATVSKPGTAALTGGASKPAAQPSGAPPAKAAPAPVPPAKQAPPAAPAAKAPSPTDVPPAVFESASHNMRPLGYRAAVRLPNGEVFSGPEHAHALDNAAANASMRVDDATTHYGFVDKDQHFISMQEADRILEKNWYKERNLPEPPAKAPLPPPAEEATGIGPKGSTVGVPNPSGGPSPDDPRVKKQKDNLTKGEHFVPGDDFHEQLLSGLPGGHGGRQRQILGQAEQAISDKSPLHISYISAPKEAEKFPTRESRRIQYDEHSPEARLMGTTEGQLVGHSFIPTAVGISPARKVGEPHQSYIQGLSTNILANNFQHVNDKLAAIGRKTPYQQLGQKFFNDMEGYFANLNAGHTATGRGHVLGTEDHPSEPDRSHVPYKLSRSEADFIGTVLNNTAAFAKHGDAEKLRELARVNGTLITPEGETNRLRHEIEQSEPGWRQRVLEPSIRSFKTGLVHEVHPDEEHMPATIRPGKEYQQLTKALARTSERGRPDVPVAASLHHTFADNKAINQIERDFSQERISEQEARARLHALGEDPDQFQFIGGSGGLITPYEENPEAITPEEHTELKTNLRRQWIGGKMPIEDYRRKAAEVPLPEKPSQSPTSSPATPETETAPSPKPITPVKPKPPKPQPEPEPEPVEAEETPETPLSAPKPAAPIPKPKPTPKAPQEPPEAPEPAAAPTQLEQPKKPETKPEETEAAKESPTTPPAPGDILPPAKPKKAAKSKEQAELEAEDMRQAAIDRDNISPEDQAGMNRLNKKSKAWIKQNPDVDELSMHAHLTGKRAFPGKLKNEQIGEYYDANNPKLDYGNDEHRERVSHAVVHDIMHSLAGTTTGGKPSTAYGWYDRTVRKSLNKAAEIAPQILTHPDHGLAWKLAWAITSQGQDVFPNTESTWHAYRHWVKTGKLPESREIFGGGQKAEQMEENFKKINKLWHGDENQEGLGHERLQKLLMKRMTVGQLEKKFGLKVPGELKDHEVNGAMSLGAKIGAFFSNLNGDYDPTTMDLWFSRNMNLMAGNMFGFSDEATRKDRMEKGKLVRSHLGELKDALDSGMLSIDQGRAKKMSDELGALMAHPEGQLDRPTARTLAPEIYNWAREQHGIYQKSAGLERSYHENLKTPENLTAKKIDENATQLSNAPRNGTERSWWRDVMRRAGDKLKAAGVRLTNADKQALLWFNIKDLFRLAGSPQRDKADYLDATYRLVRKVKSGELPGLQETPATGGVLHMQGGGLVGGVLHMQPGGVVPQPSEVPGLMTLGGTGQQSSSPLLGQTTAPAAPDLTPAPRALPANTPAPRALPAQTPAVTTGPANYTTLGQNMSGLATNFGHDLNGNPDQYMLKTLGPSSRIGAFGADVTNPQTTGVSLPIKTIQDNIGNYQKNAQIRRDIANGRYQVVVNAPNGNSGMFHIVDVGPGPNEPGKIDITGSAMKQLGVTGNFNADFHIVDTAAGQAQSVRGYQEGGLVT